MEEEMSLMDGAEPASTEESTETTETPAWMLSEGVTGEGDRPDWFSDKYDSVAEQAKGYNELSTRLGGFTGAPEEYTLSAPEDMGMRPDGSAWLNDGDPSVEFIREIGKAHNMNQDMFDALTHGWLKHTTEALQQTHKAEMEALGPQGPAMLGGLTQWGNTHLTADEQDIYRSMATTADQVRVLTSIIGKTKNAAMVDTTKTANTGVSREDLDAMVADPRYKESPAWRKQATEGFQKKYPSE
jgi:hypothetical protein